MGTWQAAFLHEFPDGNPINFRAVPGELTVIPDGLVPQPTPEPDKRGFAIRPGRHLSFAFANALTPVIGFDIAMDLFVPPTPGGLSARVDLGDSFHFIAGFASGLLRLQLLVGVDATAVSVSVPLTGPISLRARWHTHGQAHFWVNGELVRYDPALSAETSFNVDRLTFGQPFGSSSSDSPAILARRVCVKVLRQDDANKALDQLLPIQIDNPLSDECERRIAGINSRALSVMRKFMSTSVTKLTTSWQRGQAHAPFSPESVAAHQAALDAGRSLAEFLLHQRSADSEQFVQRLGDFLAILQTLDPAGYANVVSEFVQLSDLLEPECRAALQPAAQQHAAKLGPVAGMLQAMWAKIQSPGGS